MQRRGTVGRSSEDVQELDHVRDALLVFALDASLADLSIATVVHASTSCRTPTLRLFLDFGFSFCICDCNDMRK
ncbi:hypothetical protein LINPERPRIM_LOCUS40994 [Linum perenne]